MIYVAAVESGDNKFFVLFAHTLKDDFIRTGPLSDPEYSVQRLNGIVFHHNKWTNIHDANYSEISDSSIFPNKNSAQRALLGMVFK